MAFYNIKLETVKTVAYEELLSDAVELKHDNDVVDLPPVKIEATSTTCAVVKKNWKHPGTNSLKLLTQSNGSVNNSKILKWNLRMRMHIFDELQFIC